LRAKRDTSRAATAHLAQADLGDHPLEAGAGHAARGGAPQIVVHDLDLGPAEGCEPVAHGVLQRAAFRVVQDLVRRGLAHVDDRLARQVVRLNLFSGHGDLRRAARRLRAPAAGAPASR